MSGQIYFPVFDPSFDRKHSYRSQSMLVVPMKDTTGEIIGVLQLISAQDEEGSIIAFAKEDEEAILALGSQAAVAIKNVWLNRNLKNSYLEMILRLGLASEYRDKETGKHIKRMSEYSRIMASRLGMSEEEQELILFASPMHDIGKVGIPDSILQKPGILTPEERTIMQTHTVIGEKILSGSDIPLIQLAERIAVSHHERWDGNGYPHKLKGEDIPLEGRIVALADVFDALSNKRCYKEAWEVGDVLTFAKKNSGSQFDPTVVEAFFAGLEDVLVVFSTYKEV